MKKFDTVSFHKSYKTQFIEKKSRERKLSLDSCFFVNVLKMSGKKKASENV